MSEIARDQRRRIAGFDGLRALGFLLVFVSHKFPSPRTEMCGTLGVWLFFVLSGFLITRILYGLRAAIERGEITFWSALRNIYVRRSVRILPIFYALLIALIPASFILKFHHFSLAEQIAYWTHTTNFYVAEHGWVGRFGHFWSLAVEVQYYALFAVLALLTPTNRIWLLCCLFIVWGTYVNIELVRSAPKTILLDVHSALGFALFGLGGLAGLVAGRARIRRITQPAVMAPALLIFLAWPFYFHDVAQFASYGRASAVLAALLLVAFYRHPDSPLVRAFDWRPLAQLGTISYATYLLHPFVSVTPLETAIVASGGNPALVKIASASTELAITVALAVFSWHMLEKPAIDWGRRRTAK